MEIKTEKFRENRKKGICRMFLGVFCLLAVCAGTLSACGVFSGEGEHPGLGEYFPGYGIGRNEKEEKEQADIVRIPVIFTVDPTTGKKNNQELAEAFNKAYEGKYILDVEWVLETEEEYRQNLKRMNVTDKLPAVIYDVCTVPAFYQMMVEEGRLENLNPYLEKDPEWREAIEPAVLKACTYAEGEIYLGPISTAAFTCSGMYWNAELFEQAQIEKFPETWEEFWECCERLKDCKITPLSLHTEGTGWAPMLIATAAVAQTSQGEAFLRLTLPDSYNNESGLRLGSTLQKLFEYTTEDALHSDFDVAYNNFFSGRCAMLPNGYWMMEQIPQEWKEKIHFSAFPENTLVASPETFGWAVVADYGEEVKEAAVEFLKFRTFYNQQEKERLFSADASEEADILSDYRKAYSEAVKIIPNYQVKWNSILQEETLGEILPLLAEKKKTPRDFVQMADESIKEYQAEK